jgi:hypothetical protein
VPVRQRTHQAAVGGEEHQGISASAGSIVTARRVNTGTLSRYASGANGMSHPLNGQRGLETEETLALAFHGGLAAERRA